MYFNALYNANQLFNQGRREIDQGREASGRAALASSIEKAEKVVLNNPNSRWADDAQRLVVRAHLLREEWPEALAAARSLMRYASSKRDSAEVAGYLGRAEQRIGDAEIADSLLSLALAEEKDGLRRAGLLYSRGLARGRLQRIAAAETDLSSATTLRPKWVAPRIERVRLLVDAGRGRDGAAGLRGLMQLSMNESDEARVVEAVRQIAKLSSEIALDALVSVEGTELRRDNRSELLKLRGDLVAARGEQDRARADYALAAVTSPESRAATSARLAVLRMNLAVVSTLEEMREQRADIERLGRRSGGRAVAELTQLLDTFVRVEYWMEAGNLGYILAAEAARDIFGAPRLAKRLFLEYADGQPQSLWAPKALLAALDLSSLDSGARANPDPDEPDAEQLRLRLVEDYRDSPYVKALIGGEGQSRFSFEELELGLRRQLERLENLANQEVRAQRSTSTR